MQPLSNENESSIKQGLVISYFGNSVAVEMPDGQVFQCHLRRNQDLPVVGDHVTWQLEKSHMGVILSILPRRSLLSRGNERGEMKPLAANIDLLFIVMAPPPIFSEYLIDRYLIAAELLSIQAVLVLNKIDLMDDHTKASMEERLTPYRAIYPVYLSSAISQEGLATLVPCFKGKNSVLIGPSGVGKSSMIAGLCQQASIRVGQVSPKGSGKHTTTSSSLYHLLEGGHVIDSPGVREFSLWRVSKEDIFTGFKEFQGLDDCKFRDCIHLQEPGCVVKTAVLNGEISKKRYESYQKLILSVTS